MTRKEILHLISLKNYNIYDQLLLEEALLRTTDQNFCLLNQGSPRAIVLGISGKVPTLVNRKAFTSSIPIIKRYSGGGGVIVDEKTLFVSFIFQKKSLPFVCSPLSVLQWSETFYKQTLEIPTFHLRENDYAIGEKKCGGNAQYIQKNRFVHHTTFLWDFKPTSMDYLLYPRRTPKYRKGRSHLDFLCRIKDHLSSEELFLERVKIGLEKRFSLKETDLSAVHPLLSKSHRKVTCHLNWDGAGVGKSALS